MWGVGERGVCVCGWGGRNISKIGKIGASNLYSYI